MYFVGNLYPLIRVQPYNKSTTIHGRIKVRRSASEVIRDLEVRIANLEKNKEQKILEEIAKFKNLYLDGLLDRATYRVQMTKAKEELEKVREADPSWPKVGDILYSSWGDSSMTIVDFYKVIKVSPSGKSVSLQALHNDVVEGDAGYRGYVMPSNKEDRSEKPILNKRVYPAGSHGYSVIKVDGYAKAYKWDGKKKYFNRMD